MARNTALSDVLLMLKGQVGHALTAGVATAADQALYTLIDNKQKWLAEAFEWPFMDIEVDVSVAPAARYVNLPTTIDFDRNISAQGFFTNVWHELEYGIDKQEYNALSSGDGKPVQPIDPIQRWTFKPGDASKFEVWPIPVTAQTIRFRGRKVLTSLKTAGSYDPAKTLDLDDLLVVLFVAAEYLARMKKNDASVAAGLAQARFTQLRAAYSSRERSFVLGGAREERVVRRVVPIVTVA